MFLAIGVVGGTIIAVPSHAQDPVLVLECATNSAPEEFRAMLYRDFADSIAKDDDLKLEGEIEAQLSAIFNGCIDPKQFNTKLFDERALVLLMAHFMGSQVSVEARRRLETLGIDPTTLDKRFLPILEKLPLDQAFFGEIDENIPIKARIDIALDDFIAKSGLDPQKVEVPIKAYLMGATMQLLWELEN